MIINSQLLHSTYLIILYYTGDLQFLDTVTHCYKFGCKTLNSQLSTMYRESKTVIEYQTFIKYHLKTNQIHTVESYAQKICSNNFNKKENVFLIQVEQIKSGTIQKVFVRFCGKGFNSYIHKIKLILYSV